MRKECLTISINTIVMLRDLVVIQQMNKQRFTSASVLRRSDSNEKGSTKTVNLEKEKKMFYKCISQIFSGYIQSIGKKYGIREHFLGTQIDGENVLLRQQNYACSFK